MPAPQNAGLPAFFTLANGYTLRITALDPATGDENTDVVISNASIAVDQDTGSTDATQTPGQIFLVPGPALAP